MRVKTKLNINLYYICIMDLLKQVGVLGKQANLLSKMMKEAEESNAILINNLPEKERIYMSELMELAKQGKTDDVLKGIKNYVKSN